MLSGLLGVLLVEVTFWWAVVEMDALVKMFWGLNLEMNELEARMMSILDGELVRRLLFGLHHCPIWGFCTQKRPCSLEHC